MQLFSVKGIEGLSMFLSDLPLRKRSLLSNPLPWCNGSVFSENLFLGESDCISNRGLFLSVPAFLWFKSWKSRSDSWLRILILAEPGPRHRYPERQIPATPQSCLQGLPSNRCSEIMRDLSQQINNWTFFFLYAVIVRMKIDIFRY